MKEGNIHLWIMKENRDGRSQDFPNYFKITQIKSLVHAYPSISTSQCPPPSAFGRAMKLQGLIISSTIPIYSSEDFLGWS